MFLRPDCGNFTRKTVRQKGLDVSATVGHLQVTNMYIEENYT